MDKNLKKIFIHTHDVTKNIFSFCLGKNQGVIVKNKYEEIISNRNKPVMSTEAIDDLVKREEENLKDCINGLL